MCSDCSAIWREQAIFDIFGLETAAVHKCCGYKKRLGGKEKQTNKEKNYNNNNTQTRWFWSKKAVFVNKLWSNATFTQTEICKIKSLWPQVCIWWCDSVTAIDFLCNIQPSHNQHQFQGRYSYDIAFTYWMTNSGAVLL